MFVKNDFSIASRSIHNGSNIAVNTLMNVNESQAVVFIFGTVATRFEAFGYDCMTHTLKIRKCDIIAVG